MRPSGVCALVLQLSSASLLAAQSGGVSAPGEHQRSRVLTVGFVMPTLSAVRRPTPARVVATSAQFTEFEMVLAISANTAWELLASTLPPGVAIRNQHGGWSTSDSVTAAFARGPAVNRIEVTISVRVGPAAGADWERRLALRVRPLGSGSSLVVN